MKFVINAKELKDALALTNASVDKRRGQTTSVIYINAHKGTDSLILFTTDGICKTMVKLDAAIEQGGETCIDHALFQKQVSTVPSNENILCEMRGEKSRRFHIESGQIQGVTSIRGIRGKVPEQTADMEMIKSWLKLMPIGESKVVMTVPTQQMLALVQKVGPHVMQEGDQDNMKKLRIKASGRRLIGEGTNRSVLAFASQPIDKEFKEPIEVSFPSRGLDPLIKALQYTTSEEADILTQTPNGQTDPTSVYIRTENLCFGISTNGLVPPQIEPFINRVKPTLQVEVLQKDLAEAVARATGFGSGTARYIQITVGGHGSLIAKGEIFALDSAFEQEVEATTIHPNPNLDETQNMILQAWMSGAIMTAITAAPESDKIRISIDQNAKQQLMLVSSVPTPKPHPDAAEPEEEQLHYLLITRESIPMELSKGPHGGSLAAG